MWTSILQALYEFTQWQYFWFLLIVWIIVDLVWFGRWQKMIARMSKLVTKPVIFEKDDEPNNPVFYPRRFMESLAQRRTNDTGGNLPINPFEIFVDF